MTEYNIENLINCAHEALLELTSSDCDCAEVEQAIIALSQALEIEISDVPDEDVA